MPPTYIKTHDGLFTIRTNTFFPKTCGNHRGIPINYIVHRKKYTADVECKIVKTRIDGQIRGPSKCLVCTSEDYEDMKRQIDESIIIVAKWEIKTHNTGTVHSCVNNYGIPKKVLEELKKK